MCTSNSDSNFTFFQLSKSLDIVEANHQTTLKKEKRITTGKTCMNSHRIMNSVCKKVKKVTWADYYLEKVVLFDKSEPVSKLPTQNILPLQDLPQLLQQGSLLKMAPNWSLKYPAKLPPNWSLKYPAKLPPFSKTIQLVSIDILCKSQLLALFSIPNWAFEKKVELIYTFNDWKSVLTMEMSYHSSSTDSNDLFQVHLDLWNVVPLATDFKYCIKYTYGSDQMVYYENNNGLNFTIPLLVSYSNHTHNTKPQPCLQSPLLKLKKSSKRTISGLLFADSIPRPPSSMLHCYQIYV